jgi:hypothetical protein
VSSHHVLGGWLAELDVADGVLERGELGAWTAWDAVLADLCMPELELFAVRVAVDVDVGDAHCECGCVWDV